MKILAKRILERLVLSLPWGGRRAILEALCREQGQYQMLMNLAAELNVSSFGVRGAYGVLHGSARDASILRAYAESGVWAARTVGLVEKYLEDSGGFYIDIGANIGATTIPIAKNPKIACLALEPEPTNHQHLIGNVRANCEHSNVEIRQIAVFNAHGTMQFEISPINMGDHRLRLNADVGALGEEHWHSIEVSTAPLDEIAPVKGRPLVIKIDTQGAEPFVVAGGQKTISRADLIIMEFSPYMMARMKADQSAMLKFLKDSFDWISIALGENDPIPAPIPSSKACEILSALEVRPDVYVDIITGRDVCNALKK